MALALYRGLATWPHLLRCASWPRRDVLCFTMGQSGLLALVEALMRYTGPLRRLTVSTWSGEGGDVRAVDAWCGRAAVGEARWLIDATLEGRSPALRRVLERRFGADAIAVGSVHAKFALLEPVDGAPCAVICSASLDSRRRLEHWLISPDGDVCAAVEAAADAIAAGHVMPASVRAGRLEVSFSDCGSDLVERVEAAAAALPGQALSVGVWTCSAPHHRRVRALLDSGAVSSVRWLVDTSMLAGTPGKVLQDLREVWGDDSIRGCSLHGKFFRLGALTHWTSANLNRNPRVETHVSGYHRGMAALTDAILDMAFERQAPGACWLRGRTQPFNRSLQHGSVLIHRRMAA